MSQAVFNWVRKGILRKFLWLGLFMWLVGGAIFTIEYYTYGQWDTVQGEITYVKTYTQYNQSKGKSEPVYDFHVVYKHKGYAGIVEKEAFSGEPKFQKGDTHPVLVNPDQPQEAHVRVGFEAAVITPFLIGAFFLLISGIAYITDPQRKQRRAAQEARAYNEVVGTKRQAPAPKGKDVR